MSSVAQDVLPIFILIFFGWSLVRFGVLKEGIGEGLGDFVFRVAVPMLLFRTIAHADFHGSSPFRLWIAYFAGVAIAWTIGHLIATRVFGHDSRIGVLAGVSAGFANNVFIGLPLVERTVGPEGIVAMSILLAVHLPLMMIAGTLLMERAEQKTSGRPSQGLMAVSRQVALNLVRNPLIIGLIAGIIVQTLGLPIPAVLDNVVGQVAGMAAPAALISLGMTLNQYGMAGNVRIAGVVSTIKLVLMPACVWAVATLLGLSPQWTAALVLTSSVPTGINAWLIANRFGVGQGLAASVITLSTAVGVLTVSLWALLLL
ncbi:AEC family transporter [Rhizobium sp. AAP43]|uniref:AEC family transporter n=1 Tax=Rhizobium sp. AAP43 TaxID=1523420 RepID=UPI0006B8D974|nr:AEC family transporter [Rhizobium sp. AAP43]KPF44425.1 transporter [Rhizobium sp. AAP43]